MDSQETKEYLVNQVLAVQQPNGNSTSVTIQALVRFVEARNKEEAIGKFVQATADLFPAYQRLKIECELKENYIRIT